jgi:phasin family protein
MAQKNPFADFFSQNDFAKLFENYQSAPFDLKALLETQRKNVQAISEANQIAMGNLQTIAQRQTEILSQIVEDNSSLAKELMTEGTPEEKIAKNAKLFKNIYERTVGNMQELSEMINKSNQEASKIINKRVTATMNEIQSSLEKTPSKKEAA